MCPSPNPPCKFEGVFECYPELMENIERESFQKPTPIQSQTSMANISARDRSYWSNMNWNREDVVLFNAWIYSSKLSTSS